MSFFFQQTVPKDLELISIWWPMLTSYKASLGILYNLEKNTWKTILKAHPEINK